MSLDGVKIAADNQEAALDALFLASCLTRLLAQTLPNQEALCHASAGMTASLANKLIYAARDWVETSGR